ncbi:MAG: glycosyltransferase [Vampirovibrionales bacterium]|nr:glycosyltransferase [Vampirovibrionales bacterium]
MTEPVLDSLTHGIIRDKRYEQTYRRDMRKQRRRRLTRRILAKLERTFTLPRLQKLNERLIASGIKRPPISVMLPVLNGVGRIEPLVAYLRAHLRDGDEIVIGVDSKCTDASLAVCQRLADTCFEVDNNALTCNGMLGELATHCKHPWILRLDDDEWPEPALFELLPALLHEAEQKNITHAKLPRLHLCLPKTDHAGALYWIDDGYLYPDYQLRLFKNNPSLLSFPGAIGHTNVSVAGKSLKLHSINLVHLNLAIYSPAQRTAKLRRYIDRHEGGWVHPVNEHALLWEKFNYQLHPYRPADATFAQALRAVIYPEA